MKLQLIAMVPGTNEAWPRRTFFRHVQYSTFLKSIWVQNSFWISFGSGFGFLFGFLSFLVPFALCLQQFGTRICHFAWYLLNLGMVTLHFAWHLLHLAMFAFHVPWYLPRFGTSTSHVHGLCYILVLQTFMWVS